MSRLKWPILVTGFLVVVVGCIWFGQRRSGASEERRWTVVWETKRAYILPWKSVSWRVPFPVYVESPVYGNEGLD